MSTQVEDSPHKTQSLLIFKIEVYSRDDSHTSFITHSVSYPGIIFHQEEISTFSNYFSIHTEQYIRGRCQEFPGSTPPQIKYFRTLLISTLKTNSRLSIQHAGTEK